MKKIEINGTLVEVEVVNGLVSVNVDTADADVVVNGQKIWSTFEKEEYRYIPEYLRNFILAHGDDVGFEPVGSRKGSRDVYADCYYPDLRPQATFYIEQNQKKPIKARFDYVDDLEMLKSEYIENVIDDQDEADKVFAVFKDLDNKLRETVEKYGFKWEYSHSMGEMMYGWWDIVVTNETWNEEGFVECWKIISEFNDELNKFIDQKLF